jgi:nicastrin
LRRVIEESLRILVFSGSSMKNLTSSLSRVAVILAEELYSVVSGGSAPSNRNLSFAEELVEKLLPCYLRSALCPLFSAASPPGTKLPDQLLPMYVSVARSDNPATTLTGQLLALLTGETLPELKAADCSERHLLWMAGHNGSGVCVNATANYSAAVSPAFVIEGKAASSGENLWPILYRSVTTATRKM